MRAHHPPDLPFILTLPPEQREQQLESLLAGLPADGDGHKPWVVDTVREGTPDNAEALHALVQWVPGDPLAAPARVGLAGAPLGPVMLMFGGMELLSLGWAAFKWISGRAAGAAVGKLGDMAFGRVLQLIGWTTPTDEILTQLKVMDGKLDHLGTLVDGLARQNQHLLQALQIATGEILSEVNALELKASVDVIENCFGQLRSRFVRTAATARTPAAIHEAARFAQELLSPSAHNLRQRLWNVHSSVVGASPGTTGALAAMTRLLIARCDAGHDLLDAYGALEGYFGQLLAIQAKGLLLMTEVLNQAAPLPPTMQRSAPAWRPGTTTTDGEARQFLDAEFMPRIQIQVDHFLDCVDRLVVHHADVRSDLVKRPPLFDHLDAVERVYARADLLAHQVAPANHPAGIVVRLVGEPGNIEAALREQALSCDGRPLKPVAVGGETVRHLAPNWPKDFAVPRYLEWQWVAATQATLGGVPLQVADDHRRFVPATTIAVAKLAVDAQPPAAGSGRPTVQMTHERSQVVELAAWSEDGTRRAAPADERDTWFGSVLFPIRHLPSLRDLGQQVLANDGGWALNAGRDLAHATLRLGASMVPAQCNTSYRGQMRAAFHWLVLNGSSEAATLDISGKVASEWNDGVGGSMIWWTEGRPGATGTLTLAAAGDKAATPAAAPATWNLGTQRDWSTKVDGRRVAPGESVSIALAATLDSGRFLFRLSPVVGSKFRMRCHLPKGVSASASAELKSLELKLR